MAEKSAKVPPSSPHTAQEANARAFYEVLLKAANEEFISGAKVQVFRGYLGEQFRLTGLPQSQYHPAKVLLEYNGAIEVTQRAWRGSPGEVVLLGLPEVLRVPPRTTKDLTATDEFARLQDRVKRLENLVGDIHLPSVLEEIAHRLDGREESNG